MSTTNELEFTMPTLLPCPSCGGEAERTHVYFVSCKDQSCLTGAFRDTPEEAIAAWNELSEARQLARAVRALGAEDGPYNLTKAANGAWCIVVDEDVAIEWGYPLADALIGLAKRITMMEAQS